MATFLYIDQDPAARQRAAKLGCGWMPDVPAQYASVATAPCAIVSGAGQTIVLPEPTTPAAVAAAAAPILAAENEAAQAEAGRRTNADSLRAKAEQALSVNARFTNRQSIGGVSLPASPTNTQSIAYMAAYLDVVAKELNGLARLVLNLTDDVSDT